MPFYTVQGRNNYYMEFGEGRPVLLLHGISNSGRAWGPQIHALVQKGFRVIVPDHAGHGASGRLNAPFSVDDFANDLEALLTHLGVGNLDVVGLSLGGMIALALALRYPNRIDHLIVANSFDKTATAAFQDMAEGWAQVFEQPYGPIIRLEQNWPSLVSPAFQKSAEGLRTYQIWHGIAATVDGLSLAHVARGIGTFDVSNRLGQLTMPTLFIAGGLDRMSMPETSRRMTSSVPNADFVLIEDAAHISNVDAAEAFTTQMLDFLEKM